MSGLCLVASLCFAGCADSPAKKDSDHTGTLTLRAACPGVHLAYDALVAADPASARAFHESLRRLWGAGVEETRRAVKPVLDASKTLAATDRAGFPDARDGVYDAIVTLSATCATYGSPILH